MRNIMAFNFGSMQVFNKGTLTAGKSIKMLEKKNTEVIIIPLSGIAAFKDGAGNEACINPGLIQLFSAAIQSSYEMINSFEIQSRLLHPKDGLAIWNTGEIDFETLSNEAILLLFEVPL